MHMSMYVYIYVVCVCVYVQLFSVARNGTHDQYYQDFFVFGRRTGEDYDTLYEYMYVVYVCACVYVCSICVCSVYVCVCVSFSLAWYGTHDQH